jgi:hypothetical protein
LPHRLIKEADAENEAENEAEAEAENEAEVKVEVENIPHKAQKNTEIEFGSQQHVETHGRASYQSRNPGKG